MIKYRLNYIAILIFIISSTVGASAQSGEVLRKLLSKYSVVAQGACDGIIMVNKGGERNPERGTPNGKYGYVDTLGREIVAPIYDHAEDFHNGFAVVAKGNHDNRRYGLIDRTGRVVIPIEWRMLGGMNDGICVAGQGENNELKISLIDTLGNVRPVKYNLCSDFSEGLAVVGVGEYVEKENPYGLKTATKKYEFVGKFGYITPDGELAVPVQFDEAYSFRDNGLAIAGMQGKYYIKCGFIDRSGEFVIPCDYYSVEPFNYGRALVGKVMDGAIVYGYIDPTGNEVIPCQYETASSFSFPNTWVGQLEPDGETAYTLIDITGKSVLPYKVFNLQRGGAYGQVVAARRDESGRLLYGVIGFSGKTIVPFQYDEITIYTTWNKEKNRWQEAGVAVKNGIKSSFDMGKRD